MDENDRVGHILEHPLSYYTSSNGEESQKSDRKFRKSMNPEERDRRSRRQVMSTEYQRTINKSAERHKKKEKKSDKRRGSVPDAYAEAYGNLVPPAPRVELPKAALVIPSF